MAGFQASFEPGPHPVAAPEHYPLPDHDRQHALPDDDRPSGSAAWGGLPAPWEPLPAWLTTPAPAPSTPTSSAAADAAQDNLGPGGDNAAALPVYAAEHGRDTDADGSATTPGVTPAPSANPHERTVEPDLDALARQVYTLLRRRLASEQRRFG
jgi:hypothetical protein